MSGIKVKQSLDVNEVKKRVHAAIQLLGRTAAQKLEGEAKQNASWQDQTGNARNSIQGKFERKGDKAVIELSGNVNYFVYLELAHEKKYAILVPTIEKNTDEILRAFGRLAK